MTIKKKLIGYGYTDSNGVATLDYDENGTEISTLAPTGSSGYIGKGVGSVQLEAGLHSSEAVVSEPCDVLDCIKYDNGTTTGNPNIWSTPTTSSSIIVRRTDEYCEFKEATSSNMANQVGGLTDSCIIEFDYWQLNGLSNTFMQIVKNGQQITTGGINLGMFNGSLENWYHIKLTIQNGIMTALNTTNGATFTKNLSDTPEAFNFWSSGDITTLRFKEFKVYPI